VKTISASNAHMAAETYQGWDALRIEQGPLALILVPSVGGRIMGVQWHGQELSFVNPDCQGRVDDVATIADVHACKRRLGFVLWGGDKTWLAPQSRWTDEVPFIDLDSGAYELTIDERHSVAKMASPICRETGVQIERTLQLGQQPGSWSLMHTLHNRSPEDVSWAPWDVAMMVRPATIYLPTRADSRFPKGLRTFDNEGESSEARDQVVRFVDTFAVISCRDAVKFKYGVDADAGRVLAVIEGGPRDLIGIRKSVPTYHPQPYAHGCVVEVFNAADHPYFELELHGPVVTLAPGQSFTLGESALLFDLEEAPVEPASIRKCLGL
jgi:hypothetical protein